jgi:hypothetical protein
MRLMISWDIDSNNDLSNHNMPFLVDFRISVPFDSKISSILSTMVLQGHHMTLDNCKAFVKLYICFYVLPGNLGKPDRKKMRSLELYDCP